VLYISQNLLGTIFRVTFTVFYRRIWSIVGKYSILCCDIHDEYLDGDEYLSMSYVLTMVYNRLDEYVLHR
jgi:hypothetical protein